MCLYDFLDVNVKFIDAEMTTIEDGLEATGLSLPQEQPRMIRAARQNCRAGKEKDFKLPHSRA